MFIKFNLMPTHFIRLSRKDVNMSVNVSNNDDDINYEFNILEKEGIFFFYYFYLFVIEINLMSIRIIHFYRICCSSKKCQ